MSGRRIRVLVMDDDEGVRRNLGMFLEDEGFEVVLATTGEEALELLPGREVDVVVVDIRLPGMNGNEFILRAHGGHPTTRFVIYTGSPDYAPPLAVVASGVHADEVIRKPLYDMKLLADAIRRLAGETDEP